MMDKFFKLYEKYFYLIIIFFFICITYIGLLPLYDITNNNPVLKFIVETNNSIFKAIRDYRYIFYTFILIISSIYVYFKGNKKNKIMLVIILITAALTFMNSILTKQHYFISLEIRYIVSFPLFFVFLNVFEIFLRKKGKYFIEDLLFKTIKIIVIYIGIMFILGKITNLYNITYRYAPYGYAGRFKERNAISHIFVMIIPVLMYSFYSKKEYKTIFYIIISIICALLIGTKSAYFAVYVSLFLYIIVSIIDLIINKKINVKKTILISAILITLFIINDKLYTTQFIRRGIDLNTYEVKETTSDSISEEVDIKGMVLNGRSRTLREVKWIYNHEPLYTKIIGMGYYYPKYPYVIVEMDFFDILFKQGVVGLSLFLYTVFYYIFLIIKSIKKNYKRLPLVELILPLSSIGMGLMASMLAGHIIFNYVTLFFYSLIIIYFVSKVKLRNK